MGMYTFPLGRILDADILFANIDPIPQANANDGILEQRVVRQASPDATTIDGSPSDAPIASHNTNANVSILEQQLVRWASPDATTIDGSPSDAPIASQIHAPARRRSPRMLTKILQRRRMYRGFVFSPVLVVSTDAAFI